MGRTISLAEHVEEIELAAASRQGGFLRRGGRRLRELIHGARSEEGRLLVTDDGLVIAAPGSGEGLEIPWSSLRKVVVDDGSRWGYVSGVCRFPVYDLRADGSGSGVLIGPLWSQASSLMPAACPVLHLDPVPAKAPNIALIFDPHLSAPATGRPHDNGGGPGEPQSIAALMLRVQDPLAARETLAARHQVADVTHGDLEFLSRAPGKSRSGRRAPGEDASAAASA